MSEETPELDAEREQGKQVATAVVDHALAMGCAMANIPITDEDGNDWMVTVARAKPSEKIIVRLSGQRSQDGWFICDGFAFAIPEIAACFKYQGIGMDNDSLTGGTVILKNGKEVYVSKEAIEKLQEIFK